MKSKLITSLILLIAALLLRYAVDAWIQPAIITHSALAAAAGDGHDAIVFRTLRGEFAALDLALAVGIAALGWRALLCTAAVWARRKPHFGIALTALVLLPSCKPFDKPEYVQVGNNETAFVIPLEDTKERQDQQIRFDSEVFLNEAKVLAKRIQVPHRWEATGRLWFNGTWLPTVVIMKVDRSPITREWTSSSASRKGSDKAIWIESADSVGFSMGVSCTAYITEQDSAKFLYMYPSGSLADVMDTEVRARIQKIAAEQAAKYPLDQLRERKAEIMTALDQDIVPFFEKRGIAITTIGMFGGMTYENPHIQESIDEVFVAQQQKNVALAEFEAQEKMNERVLLSAKADAEQLTIKATAEAQKKTTEAEAESRAIEMVSQSLRDCSPAFLQIRALDAQLKQIERWNGAFPTTFIGGPNHPTLLLNLPETGVK
ncbi:MAG: hypothetical protein KDK97_20325 [Verrucomicrobiales bacterium]|nr:hypothetical protein [Verrucomicrobiales bacterium]MCP5558874.1 hypothetical protein [Verrucomicrobiaceae bacterium]